MFGYVKPIKEELKVREYELYRAYYCGLCKSIKKNHNNTVRLALNYDFAFLGLLLSSMEEKEEIIQNQRCMMHPVHKRKVVINNKNIDYAANMSILLMYLKCIDDWNDDRDIKSKVMSIPFGQALKLDENIEKRAGIEKLLDEMQILEKDNCLEIDQMAEKFGKIMEIIFDVSFIDTNENRKLKHLGFLLGTWIYKIDAIDDLYDDIEKNKYNPLKKEVLDLEKTILFAEIIENSLYYNLSKIADTFELISIKKNKAILENIFYFGLRAKTEIILKNMRGKFVEKSI